MITNRRIRRAWPIFLTAVVLSSALAILWTSQRASGEEREVDFKNRVNAAIDRGVAYLKSLQKENGSWEGTHSNEYPMGQTALVLYTLLSSGVSRDDECIQKGFAYLRGLQFQKTYCVSVLIMALEAAYKPKEPPFSEKGGYVHQDRWGKKLQMPRLDRDWMEDAAEWLLKNQQSEVWRYPTGGVDLSNTQFALLGLKSAARCGIDIPKRPWDAPVKYLLREQETDGPKVDRVAGNETIEGYVTQEYVYKGGARARGWSYIPRNSDDGKANPAFTIPTGSMTAAGVCCLIICKSELMQKGGFSKKERAELDTAICDGMAWLAYNFSVSKNPGCDPPETWLFYYLYGLERVGVLADVKFIGEHDWYRKGADYLLSHQSGAGAWGEITETCFALLFLKRATVPVLTK